MNVVFTTFLLILSVIIGAGWHFRDRLGLTPQRGTGYLLGIVGACVMLAVGLYSARKRSTRWRWLGSNALWFRTHMFLGLIGPVLILFHARFTFRATNSGVALAAMLGVAGSGVVGWFIYRHIYRGFSQRKLEMADLLAEVIRARAILHEDGDPGASAAAEIAALAEAARHPQSSLLRGLVTYLYIDLRTRSFNYRFRPGRRRDRAAAQHLATYLQAVRVAAGFAWYERLFGLWHLFHVPLFLFLIVAAIIHVLAVHRY